MRQHAGVVPSTLGALDCYGLLTRGYELAGDRYSIVTLSMCLKHFIKIHFKGGAKMAA